MKNNCKTRKLNFIREKNKIRLMKTTYWCVFNVDNFVLENENNRFENIVKQHLEKLSKELFNRFRLRFNNFFIQIIKYDGDNFLTNRSTVKITLKP